MTMATTMTTDGYDDINRIVFRTLHAYTNTNTQASTAIGLNWLWTRTKGVNRNGSHQIASFYSGTHWIIVVECLFIFGKKAMMSFPIVFVLCECTDAHFVTVFDPNQILFDFSRKQTHQMQAHLSPWMCRFGWIGFILHANNTQSTYDHNTDGNHCVYGFLLQNACTWYVYWSSRVLTGCAFLCVSYWEMRCWPVVNVSSFVNICSPTNVQMCRHKHRHACTLHTNRIALDD